MRVTRKVVIAEILVISEKLTLVDKPDCWAFLVYFLIEGLLLKESNILSLYFLVCQFSCLFLSTHYFEFQDLVRCWNIWSFLSDRCLNLCLLFHLLSSLDMVLKDTASTGVVSFSAFIRPLCCIDLFVSLIATIHNNIFYLFILVF